MQQQLVGRYSTGISSVVWHNSSKNWSFIVGYCWLHPYQLDNDEHDHQDDDDSDGDKLCHKYQHCNIHKLLLEAANRRGRPSTCIMINHHLGFHLWLCKAVATLCGKLQASIRASKRSSLLSINRAVCKCEH